MFWKLGITNLEPETRRGRVMTSLTKVPNYSDYYVEIEEKIFFNSGLDALEMETMCKQLESARFFPPHKFEGHSECFIVNPLQELGVI